MALDDRMAERSRSFGPLAEDYDRLRPGFPEQLFTDLLASAHDMPREVLEIGAGTGKATVPLLARGLDVTAVEPSPEMARVLLERAREAGVADRLDVVVAPFEEFRPERRFGIVVAAQSFHWVDPSTRWQRLADVLLPGGSAGLFWNAWMLDPQRHDHGAIRRVFEAEGTGLRPDVVPFASDDRPPEGMEEVPELVDFRVRRYQRTWALATSDYLALLATTSQFAVLDEGARATILTALGASLGSGVELRLQTELSLLTRRPDPGPPGPPE
ncbi:class I SAM-dependent methyltransferase [Propionicimonas sp.]|uniref:class I SAM-dependent methyltransferase n=1 Tax=Propionicimonas sp. TaxID=1955623 RepID=UPI0039E511B6